MILYLLKVNNPKKAMKTYTLNENVFIVRKLNVFIRANQNHSKYSIYYAIIKPFEVMT